MIGTQLAHYEILALLGQGGMGEVFSALDTKLDRRVALKVLPAEMAADPDRLERFRREARAIAALNHPNIVTLYSVEHADGRHFLTMELVEGATLLAESGERALAPGRTLDLAVQMSDALRAAHARGITHRDLKPANLMVDGEGRLKVLDFGLAKVKPAPAERRGDDATTQALTEEGLVMGTVPYMSPEQLHGRDVTPASDVFSLGVVLYEMLAGERPFRGSSHAEVISSILRDPVPPLGLSEAEPLVAPLASVLERCLAKAPEDRCTAEELLVELRRLRRRSGSPGDEDEVASEAFASVVREPASPPKRSGLVAREKERSALARAREAAAAGRGSLHLIAGEPGVGKTRLWQEAHDEALRAGFLVLVGHCREMEGSQPFLPLIEQIERAARVVAPSALRRAMGPNAPELARLMPELRQRFDDIPDAIELPPDQVRRYVLHGVTEFIERAARVQPLFLVFEDLHWSDESSLLLIRHLAEHLSEIPVMAIGTYRDTDLAPGSTLGALLQELTRGRLAAELVLRRLERDQVAEMLEDRAGQAPPHELVDRVFEETEGNPFFVDEVYRHLAETQQLFDQNGAWRSGVHRSETEVPRSVGLVVGERLQRVSEDCRKMLTSAAVVGRRFAFDVLAEIGGLDEDRLLDAIDEAESASLLEDASRGREARYRFVHEQVRQSLLAELSLPRRQRMHLRVARALEARWGQADEHASELAHHLYQAGAAAPREETLQCLLRAAEHTHRSLAFEEALRTLEAAEEVMEDDDASERGRLLQLRARILRALGRTEEALETLSDAIGAGGDDLDELRFDRARLLVDLFRGREAAADLEPLLDRARAAGDRERELALLLAMGRAHYVRSLDDPARHAEASRDTYARAHDLAEELGDRRSMALALLPSGWFTDYWRDYVPQAIANMERALELAVELGDEELELDALAARIRLLPPSRSEPEQERLRERLEARRDPLRLKELYFILMWQYWLAGRLEDCVVVCTRAMELADQLGSDPVQYPTIRALALLDLGRFDQARASLEEEVADDEHRFGACMKTLGEAVLEVRLCAWERASSSALAALDEAVALQRVWMQGWLVDLLSVLELRVAGPTRARIRERLAAVDEVRRFRSLRECGPEVDLLVGDAEAALAGARAVVAGSEERRMLRTAIAARDVELRALERLGRHEELAERSLAAIEAAKGAGARSFEWRARAHRGESLAATGAVEDAERERSRARQVFGEVVASIGEAELRAAFVADPLAASLLASEGKELG